MKLAVTFGSLSFSAEGDPSDILPRWDQFLIQVQALLQSNKELQQSAIQAAIASTMQNTSTQ